MGRIGGGDLIQLRCVESEHQGFNPPFMAKNWGPHLRTPGWQGVACGYGGDGSSWTRIGTKVWDPKRFVGISWILIQVHTHFPKKQI